MFDAEVMVNLNPSTIKIGYESVLHCGVIRQMATIVDILEIKTKNDDTVIEGDQKNMIDNEKILRSND